MARGYRELQTWPLAVDEDRIGVADAAGLHRDTHLAWPGVGQWSVDDCEFCAG
jgi:hypothetical protein